jgi:VWFA-related protein
VTTTRTVVLFASCLAATVLVGAQTSPQVQTPTPPLFRGGVDTVAVDVVATDSKNHPVTDLTVADFELTEHGRSQQITDLKYVSIPIGHRTVDLKQPPAPAPDVATNIMPSTTSRVFVMVVDDLHLPESTLVPIQRVMTEFVRTLSPDDEVGIVFVGHSDLSRNLTRDTGTLVEAIKNLRAALGFAVDLSPNPAGLVDKPGEVDQDARRLAWELKSVTQSLANSGHARRAIVLVSPGTQLDPASPFRSKEKALERSYQLEIDDAFVAARRADVPIYTLDPRGIPLPETSVRGWGAQDATARANLQRRIVVQQDHVSEIALNTGGRAFINQSNLEGAIDEIMGENGSFYLLAYSPDPYIRDGKFHDFTLKVRRPGVSLRARTGYVAADDAATTTPTATLEAAIGAGSNVAGLGLHAWVAALSPNPKGMTAAVTIEVVYPTPPDGSTHVDDTLLTSVLALGPDGEVRAQTSHSWHVAGAASRSGSVVFLINDVVTLPAKPSTVRLAVASQALRQAGTVQLPVDVPKTSDAKLVLSGVAVGLGSASQEGALGANVLAGLVPFQPTTRRSFAATDTLRVFANAFWGGKDTDGAATLRILDAETTSPTSVRLASVAGADGHWLAPIDGTVALAGLGAGDYVLDVAVTLAGGQTAHRLVPFSIK